MLPIAFVSADEETENAEDTVEEIVVTGIKKSLLDAIDIKRNKVGISEALSAEDIGKFPDENLAEALGRVAGISIIRSNVEGSQIIVRGLGPEFNMVTLNGRQMPTAPWLYESGRSFNWGDISAHGVAAIEIFKSSDSSLPTGGIGSTINMITTKPLNIAKDQVGSFSYSYVDDTTSTYDNDLESEIDFSFAKKGFYNFGTYENQYGFALSGSYQHRTNREVGMRESNYKIEAENIRNYSEFCSSKKYLQIPKVIEKFSTDEVLMMSFEEGSELSSDNLFIKSDKNKLSETLMELLLDEIFIFQFVQTDPNLANFLINYDEQKIVLLDFGSCSKVSNETRELYAQLLKVGLTLDREKIKGFLLSSGFLTDDIDMESNTLVDELIDTIIDELKSNETFDFSNSKVFDLIEPEKLEKFQKMIPKKLLNGDFVFIQRKILGFVLFFKSIGVSIPILKTLKRYNLR